MPFTGPTFANKMNKLSEEFQGNPTRSHEFAARIRSVGLVAALVHENALDQHEREVIEMLAKNQPVMVSMIAQFLASAYDGGVPVTHIQLDYLTVQISADLGSGHVVFVVRLPAGVQNAGV